MNKKNVDWNDLQLFLAVAREGGLSAAVKSTQRSAATLGRRMYALERGIGKELFIRHDRGYELLADGRKLLEELTNIEAKILNLTTPASQQADILCQNIRRDLDNLIPYRKPQFAVRSIARYSPTICLYRKNVKYHSPRGGYWDPQYSTNRGNVSL